MEVRKMFQRKRKNPNDFLVGIACGILAQKAVAELGLNGCIEIIGTMSNGSQTTNDSGDRDQEPDTKND